MDKDEQKTSENMIETNLCLSTFDIMEWRRVVVEAAGKCQEKRPPIFFFAIFFCLLSISTSAVGGKMKLANNINANGWKLNSRAIGIYNAT